MQLNEAERAYFLWYGHHQPIEECAYIRHELIYEVVVPLLPEVDVAERLFREDRLAKQSLARALAKDLREEWLRVLHVVRSIVASVPAVREWNRTQRPMWELRRILDSLPDAP